MATGENHTVREFAHLTFQELGIELEWKGKEVNEEGIDSATGKVRVGVDPYYYRPTEVDQLLGDASKAKENLGWETNISFDELVKIMVKADWKRVKKRGY